MTHIQEGMRVKLSKRALEILRRMNFGADLVHSNTEWFCGNHQTNGKVGNELLRNCLISLDSFSKIGDLVEYYHINSSGKMLLKGKTKIYRTANGEYVSTIAEAMRIASPPSSAGEGKDNK